MECSFFTLHLFWTGLIRCSFVCLLATAVSGCISQKIDPKAKWATDIDTKLAFDEYWLNLPAVERIEATDYDKLWNACEKAIVDGSFMMERFDYRTGLLTTKPLVSKQFFEYWKHDVVDFQDQVLSDAATRRRVAHFQITKLANGRYVCEVKAVVEHFSMPERRLTAVVQYQSAFSLHRQFEEEHNDDGTPLRLFYWYAEGRDEPLEHALAERVRVHLRE